MAVSVLVPYRPDGAERDRNWRYIQAAYTAFHPDWEIVVGRSPDGPFNRSAGILDAASRANGTVFVVADADVWVDCTDAVAECETWALPHCMLHRLSEASTRKVLAGADWRGLELSTDNHQDRRPYRVKPCGACVVITRDVLYDVPPDIRFAGWGGEDQAWSFALHLLVGRPWYGFGDLVHLYHPPQERLNRKVGTHEGQRLLNRYRSARVDPDRMRALIAEGVALWPSQTGSTSPARSSTSTPTTKPRPTMTATS